MKLFTLVLALTSFLATSQSHADASCQKLTLKGNYKERCNNCSLEIKSAKTGVKVITHYTLKADCSNKDGKISSTLTKGACKSIDLSDAGKLVCIK